MAKGKAYAWTPEIEQYIRDNIDGVMYKDMVLMLKEKFDFDVKWKSLAVKCRRMGCTNGINSRFQKGYIPHNKGCKGQWSPGCEKTWFKNGHKPHNHMPVGSEVVDTEGYVKVKIAEPKKWEFKHKMVWRNFNGPIPKGCAIIFRDGDRLNCDISNLKVVTKGELAVMNKNRMLTSDAETNDAAHTLAKLMIRMQRLKENGDEEKN